MISSNTNINKIRNNQNGLQDDLLTELADIYVQQLSCWPAGSCGLTLALSLEYQTTAGPS